ncbi:hydrogenase expression/formation protein HypE [Thermaerobacter sp. PB12/4term]|uniref:hydrogenase expression/formation protein HypE n=1 Tax=Thermaerobacter sp. PB12/4term TaxID=2293838 RepID=UPI000E325F66|nr:hydrogenase expression/formation protein HypE [Thermaerobacter sp. PB12/4term]QIA27579.1 hydrogenase expression/formation protein HypE [Thermaerobacter sp. PB12/4term]
METTRVRFQDPRIELAHGAGGKASRRLIEGLLVPYLANEALAELGDAAYVEIPGTQGLRLALTGDSFVVKPLRFPGGSIGALSVHGTVNDLAVAGARPLALVATWIVEAGLPTDVLEQEVEAMAEAARNAGVDVVGGDTKVVEHGKADGLYITTAGIGVVDPRVTLSAASVRPGDQILLSGPIGDHGITVLLARGELDLEADLVSDTRPLWPLVAAMIETAGPGIRWMRDPTRGGVATALNELARQARVAVMLDEEAIPVRPAVRGACEILGLDPLHIANEGQFVAVVAPEHAEAALEALQGMPGGEDAARIGEIGSDPAGVVLARSSFGGTRVVDMLVGDPLPRIC